jgi:Spy/CpxP family protein refolding chaperone
MKKLLAAIFAGMFALTTASAVIAADKKEDTKQDSKKKDSKKKDDKK